MADQYRMSAVILCGGKSRRMGTDKAMLTAEGKPNAVRLLHALSGEDSPCTEVWLSIGTGESYPAIHAQKVSDRFPGCGPMGGLEAALTVCREEYLFVAPVDTPFADAQKEAVAQFVEFVVSDPMKQVFEGYYFDTNVE